MQPGMPVREPAVAGRFYPGDRAALERAVSGFLSSTERAARAEKALLAMVPHAGYMYSGRIAGAAYAQVEVPEHVLVLGPNHTGLGVSRSLWSGGSWRCPLGEVPIHPGLRRCLKQYAALDDDQLAHLYEHALEVQLPFLKARQPRVRIAPVCLGRLALSECLALGEQVAQAIRALGEPVLIVCSTDMSHCIPASEAKGLDALALARAEAIDPEGLYRTVIEHGISMCGFVPTTVGLIAARSLGAKRGRLVRYGNSGESTGDFASVVGYAGLLVS